jgi:maleate isomerase|tara:strand:+ start:1441 stop:2166 length:726 start_codon:yes stop_codon:yes gene_type:complete
VSYEQQSQQGIGVVAPFDFALDDECWRWMPEGVPLHISRTEFSEHTRVDEQLAQDVSNASVVVPAIHSMAMARPLSVGYACTMGSFVNGNAGEYLLRETMANAGVEKPVTTSGALLDALSALGITKVAIATPYDEAMTRRLANFLSVAGVAVTKAGYLESDYDIMRIGYDTVCELARAIHTDGAQALFFSCTNLRTFDVIERLEAELGKPVLSANQVTMWATLRAGGLPMPSVNQHLFRVS